MGNFVDSNTQLATELNGGKVDINDENISIKELHAAVKEHKDKINDDSKKS